MIFICKTHHQHHVHPFSPARPIASPARQDSDWVKWLGWKHSAGGKNKDIQRHYPSTRTSKALLSRIEKLAFLSRGWIWGYELHSSRNFGSLETALRGWNQSRARRFWVEQFLHFLNLSHLCFCPVQSWNPTFCSLAVIPLSNRYDSNDFEVIDHLPHYQILGSTFDKWLPWNSACFSFQIGMFWGACRARNSPYISSSEVRCLRCLRRLKMCEISALEVIQSTRCHRPAGGGHRRGCDRCPQRHAQRRGHAATSWDVLGTPWSGDVQKPRGMTSRFAMCPELSSRKASSPLQQRRNDNATCWNGFCRWHVFHMFFIWFSYVFIFSAVRFKVKGFTGRGRKRLRARFTPGHVGSSGPDGPDGSASGSASGSISESSDFLWFPIISWLPMT